MKRPIEDRFWELVLKTEGCWIWQGWRTDTGYGRMSKDSTVGHSNMIGAHRISYMINVGPIPKGMCVLHKCDNPPCVNPSHLFLGTQADNNRDMYAKGRAAAQKRSTCKYGHPLIKKPGKYRVCRVCDNESKRRWKLRNRPAKLPPQAERTHCPQGHAYDELNTYRRRNGGRACIKCSRDRTKKYRAATKAALALQELK